jgi:hypothetical protein
MYPFTNARQLRKSSVFGSSIVREGNGWFCDGFDVFFASPTWMEHETSNHWDDLSIFSSDNL